MRNIIKNKELMLNIVNRPVDLKNNSLFKRKILAMFD